MSFDLVLSERHHLFDHALKGKPAYQCHKASILIRNCGGMVIPQTASFRFEECDGQVELGTLDYLFREERHYLFVHQDWEFEVYSCMELPELIWQ